MKSQVWLLLVSFLLFVATSPGWAREWTNTDGFSIEAELVEAKDGNVRLKRQDGKIVTVPVSKLSKADRDYLSSIAKAKKTPKPKPLPEITNSVGMKLKLIPAGEFMMGSAKSPQKVVQILDRDEDEAKYFTDEHPQHKVRITQPFYLGIHEVTQGQWKSVMGMEPWSGKTHVNEGSDYAAGCVSWEDAVAFCQKLSTKEDVTYRLPTEAEWEYACRAGTTTVYSFGDDASRLGDYAWFQDNALEMDEKYAHCVGQKKPNPWGLFDMHGNVWEWCQDCYGEYSSDVVTDPQGPTGGSRRVVRGGSWIFTARGCRSAIRNWFSPRDRNDDLGFRVARSPSGK